MKFNILLFSDSKFSFAIDPIIFGYYNYTLQKDSFYTNVTLKDPVLSLRYIPKLKNFIFIKQMNETLKRIVNTTSSDFSKDQGNAFGASVDDNSIVHLDFIFISLDYNSKQCKTKKYLIGDFH